MGRTSWTGTLRGLWAVRGKHSSPVDGTHMRRATELTHRTCLEVVGGVIEEKGLL
jgi:hypothetical protein